MMADRLRRRLPIAIVLVIVVAGLVLCAFAYWRRGSTLLGGAAVVGAVLRMVVPESDVGVLAVRSRAFDVTFLLLIAAVFAGLVLFSA